MAMLAWLAALAATAGGQPAPAPKRLLYVTHSAGFVHGSLPVSRAALTETGARAGVEVTAAEDLSYFDAGRLDSFDAVFFFTSGELPLSAAQKQTLLAFVRSGKGFGGAHSATDTLYQWPEYGDLIGAYFDGHPWVHEATVEIEDPDHPATRGLPQAFRLVEEFYQFRAFSRERVRVLMTLDPGSIDLRLPGVNRTDEDFALAWVRPYGEGRVFYTALGHFDETWRDRRFLTMLEGALRYLTGQTPEAASAPRRSEPVITRIGNFAADTEAGVIAPGLLTAVHGTGLTTGSSMTASSLPLPLRLAGTQLRVNGQRARLLSAAADRVVLVLPAEPAPGSIAAIEVTTGGGTAAARLEARVSASAPGILGAQRYGQIIALYCSGLALPDVEAFVTGSPAPLAIHYAGPAPGLAGVQQLNVHLPDAVIQIFPLRLRVRSAGRDSNWIEVPPSE